MPDDPVFIEQSYGDLLTSLENRGGYGRLILVVVFARIIAAHESKSEHQREPRLRVQVYGTCKQ
jgi:hypothetical protein